MSAARAWVSRAAAVLAVVALMAGAADLSAQRPTDRGLQRALDRVASQWARGNAGAVAARASHTGVSIDVGEGPVGPLERRQAAAMLRRLFSDVETVSLRQGVAEHVGGSPARAFGELAWSARSQGTTIPQRATVFVALVRERGEWRVTEIRLLR